MKINVIDYKGKHYTYQDVDIALNPTFDWVENVIESDDITDEQFKEHHNMCRYYGIPAYYGRDERLNKLDMKYDILYQENEQP
jgi:hypothetical protein